MRVFFSTTFARSLAFAGGVLAVWLAVLPVSAQQIETVARSFSERYPSESIRSLALADQILADADKERALIDNQYLDEQRACYQRFFVSACLDNARTRSRLAMKQVRAVEVEANAFKRQAKADERDTALVEQRAKDEQEVKRRIQEQKEKAGGAAPKPLSRAPQEPVMHDMDGQDPAHENDLGRRHAAKQQRLQEAAVAKAPERAANERADQAN